MNTGTRNIYLLSSFAGSIDDATVSVVAFASPGTRDKETKYVI